MSLSEILVILIVALIVIGPKQLPALAYKLGRWWEQASGLHTRLKHSFDQEMKHIRLEENIAKAKAAEDQETSDEQNKA